MTDHIIIAPYLQEFFVEILKKQYVVHDLLGYDQPKDIPGIELDKVRAAVTRGEATFTGAYMDQLPNMEIIANFGVGYDGIDDAAAIERGIMLTNTPDVLTAETANLALALTLAVTRKVVEGDTFIRAGRWKAKEEFAMASSIIGKTAGVVGLGRIGRAVAERLEVCGAKVIYNDIAKVDGIDYPYYADLVEMAQNCDVMVNTCIGGEPTNGLISKVVIDAMKPEAFFISASRGSVVEEPALVKALVEGRIAGAGLDVFADEPNVPEELLSMENVVLLPHTGSRTTETWQAMADLCMANMDKYFAGQPVLTPVPGSRDTAGRK